MNTLIGIPLEMVKSFIGLSHIHATDLFPPGKVSLFFQLNVQLATETRQSGLDAAVGKLADDSRRMPCRSTPKGTLMGENTLLYY